SDGIAGGVDALSGGTWLAIRGDGRFTAVTNQRALAPVVPGLRSRGLAVRELAAADDPERYVVALDTTPCATLNPAWGDAGAAPRAEVRRGGAGRRGGAPGGRPGGAPGGSIDIERLPRGIHVLCNDRLGTGGFPRGVRLHDAIAAAPLAWPAIVPALEAALADHTRVGPSPIDRIRSPAEQGTDCPLGAGPRFGAPAPAPPGAAPVARHCARADRGVYPRVALRHAVVDDLRGRPRRGDRVPARRRAAVHDAVHRPAGAVVTDRRRTLVVAGLIVGDDGRILITQRRPDQALGGQGEVPRGKGERG